MGSSALVDMASTVYLDSPFPKDTSKTVDICRTVPDVVDPFCLCMCRVDKRNRYTGLFRVDNSALLCMVRWMSSYRSEGKYVHSYTTNS